MGADNPFRMVENISAATVADWSRKLQHCCPNSRSRRRNLLGTRQRVTANADVCNKDRTYLKALAVKRRAVLCRAPSSMIDFSIRGGLRRIPIAQRDADEVATMTGRTADGASRSLCRRTGYHTTLSCFSAPISAAVNPNSARTSSVCSPNSGGRAIILLGVRDSVTGWPTRLM
jgi:hypothetical protein